MKQHQTINRVLIISIMVLLICAGCSQDKKQPVVKNGTIDLSKWRFDTDGKVRLTGDWEFYWQQLYTPVDFQGSHPNRKVSTIKLPGLWQESQIDGHLLLPHGYATYRLVAKITPDASPKLLVIRSLLSVCKVWVNGKLISSSGVLGKDKQAETPVQPLLMSNFTVAGDSLEIIIQHSNFHNVQGGLNAPIELGSVPTIRRLIRTKWAITATLAGMFLFVGIFHLILYFLYRPQTANLYFGLFCLIWAVGSVFGDGGGSLAPTLFPGLPWRLSIDLTLISYGLQPLLIILFYHALFPRYKSRLVERFYLVLGAIFVIYLLLTPPNAYGAVVRLYIQLTFGVILYLLINLTV